MLAKIHAIIKILLLFVGCSGLSVYAYHVTCVIKPMHCAQCVEDIKKNIVSCSEVIGITAVFPQRCYCDVIIKHDVTLIQLEQVLKNKLNASGYELNDILLID